MRRNQTNFKPFNPVLRKAGKRIETLFSQLCDLGCCLLAPHSDSGRRARGVEPKRSV